ncbi:conserved hypothetical protein [Candida dubliniensis CD36]|uniref:Uncharacterized protein n=2 Tax=Candida dubliniensis (strain CD36 / ATCC MYA-646 / CBS 7987 / NCPF 3949 / NRRL Y-17841) TaxID=573826 RepID=B9WDR0_CANDC|nr:conserved hypothetical protein [Candida dubliniensis CD36]CAX42816.1 conserved hypothetical protein [Candida dubliniensis CD36]
MSVQLFINRTNPDQSGKRRKKKKKNQTISSTRPISPTTPMYWVLLLLVSICMANTETYLVRVPEYYNIVSHSSPIPRETRFSRQLHRLNTTHTVLLDYPIGTIDDQDMSNTITLTYNTVSQPRSTLLVRVNNYGDNTFTNGDMLNIKLCWPATKPYDFDIGHVYMHSNELVESVEDSFDLYVAIRYKFHAFSYDNERFLQQETALSFQLYVNKLPSRILPIPLELYDTIVYLVDITIFIVWNILPCLVKCVLCASG